MSKLWVALLALVLLAGAPPGIELHGTATFQGRPLADAVVWIEAPQRPTQPRPAAVLDQRNLKFSPHVLAVQVGTTVAFPNHDRVFHDVFSFRDGKRFELGLYPVGAVRYVPFDRPGLSRVFCNIHPGMAAYVLAVESPYFAVSDRDGRFALPELPAGAFPYHAWRPGGATLEGTVDVQPGARLDVQWR